MTSHKEKIRDMFNILIADVDDRLEKTRQTGIPHWDNFETWRTSALDTIQVLYNSTESLHYKNFSTIRFTYVSVPGSPYDVQQALTSFTIALQIAKEMLR